MKTFSLLLFLTIFNFSFSQISEYENNEIYFAERLKTRLVKNSSANKNIKGSMYLTVMSPIRISLFENKTFLGHYNALNGEMEVSFSDKDEPYALSKDIKPYQIEFLNEKKVYQNYSYLEQGLPKSEFLVNLYIGNNISLLKKEIIILVESERAASGYEKDKPAEYKRTRDVYFLMLENSDIFRAPKNKKEFAKRFLTHEKVILDFIKKNKIKMTNEEALIQLVTFLNSIL